MLNIIVLIKQVPDTTSVKINPETGNLDRKGVPSIMNPFDVEAIYTAIEIARRYRGKTTALCMGPPQAKAILREAVGLGIDRGVLLTDRKFAGADTWATSYTLSRAVMHLAKDDPVDLVIAGKQTIDGDTAQVGPGVARKFGVEQLTYVSGIDDIDIDGRRITVTRKLHIGSEKIETKLPALITVLPGTSEPVYSSLPLMLKRVAFEPEILTSADIDVDPDLLGLKGSPTQVVKVFAPPEREPGQTIDLGTGNSSDSVNQLFELLSKDSYFGGGE